jgi:hypothetical protein
MLKLTALPDTGMVRLEGRAIARGTRQVFRH